MDDDVSPTTGGSTAACRVSVLRVIFRWFGEESVLSQRLQAHLGAPLAMTAYLKIASIL
jgi:hypothetical protein